MDIKAYFPKARSGITPLQYKKLCLNHPAIKYTPNFISMQRETFLQFISPWPAYLVQKL